MSEPAIGDPEVLEKACRKNGGTIDVQLTSDEEREFFRLGDDLIIGRTQYIVNKRTHDCATLRLVRIRK